MPERAAAPHGDLYVDVEVAEHPYFRRDGRDLHVTVPVAVHEAALGAIVEVPTLDGLRPAPDSGGHRSGQRLRLRGHGVGAGPDTTAGAGDLIVEILIVLPPGLDERSRDLLREFGRRNDVNVRQQLFERH